MEKIKKIKNLFNKFNLDGYLVPKNDEFFNEFVPKNKDNLKFISNFSGSYGFALILKKNNYLFVDGRYTLQAKLQCGTLFKIRRLPHKLPFDILRPLIQETFDKIQDLPPYDAQTGPALRNDEKTIETHLQMLNEDRQIIYKALTDSIQKTHGKKL